MSQMITDAALTAAEAESVVMRLPADERGRIAAGLLESLQPDTRHDDA